MDTEQEPDKDSLTQTEVAISTSNRCIVEDLHNQMVLNLSENVSQSWEDFKNKMESHIRPRRLSSCKGMSDICKELQNIDKISYGQYDILLDTFDDINHHACYRIVETFTNMILKEQNVLEETQSLEGGISTGTQTLEIPMWPLAVNAGTLANAECEEVYKHLVETVDESLTLIRELSPETQIKGIEDIDGACSESLKRIKVLYRKKDHGGENFHTGNRAIRSRDMEILTSMRGSVGLIEIKDGIKTKNRGTGFRVGDKYLMSAYHVFEERIDYILDHIAMRITDGEHYKNWIIQNFPEGDAKMDKYDATKQYFHRSPEKNLEKLVDVMCSVIDSDENIHKIRTKIKEKWCRDCVVKFFLKAGGDKLQATLSPCIPFADKDSDVIILELVTRGNTLPPRFLPDTDNPQAEATVYGYLKENVTSNTSTTDLFLDPNCQVYTSDDALTKDIEEAEQWWKSTLTKDQQSLDIYPEYSGCSPSENSKRGNITMHTSKSFVHGTSGSPVITFSEVDGETLPLVSAMYLRGHPSFYYNLQDSIRSHKPLPEKRKKFNVFRDIVERNEKNEHAGEINPKYFFEAGITLQKVKMLLDECHRNANVSALRQNIFGTTSTGKENISVQTYRRLMSCGGEPFADKSIKASLTDRILRYVAKQIPTEWKGIMNFLELPQREINAVSSNNPRDVEECAYRCLEKWRNKNATLDSIVLESELIDALKFENRMDVIHDLEEEFGITGKRGSPETTNRTESTVDEEDNGTNALSSLGIQEDEQ